MPDFDFNTLITDRSQADLDALRALLSTPMADWTAEQRAQFNQAASKGAYNYTDLNRVIAAMDDINERLTAAGYVTGYHPIIVHAETPPHTPTLPEGYTELEYIESSGTQYIDTKFKPNQDTRTVFDAYLQKRATGATYFISLSEYEPQSYYQVRIISSAQYLTSDFGNNSKNFAEIPLPGRYVIDKNKNLCTVGSESVSNTENGFQAQSDLLLLAGTTTAGALSASPGIIYACQIYDGGALTRDFIPCKDTMGNVGLYDLVGAQFYGNAGTGDFAAGPEVPPPEPDPALDPYTWYEADAPTVSLLDGYLANVAALRAVLPLPETTPPVPVDMAELTQGEANAIEDILDIIHTYLLALQSIFRRCGAAVCGGAGLYPIN